MSLGQIIRNKREELSLTLDEVSRRVGFSKPYLSTIETCKVKNPPSDQLLKKLERTLKFEPGLSDIRQAYESQEAENDKLRQFIKRLMKSKSTGRGVKTMVTKTRLQVDPEPVPLAPGRLVPVINKVAAGYPAEFNDLDYPVGIADDYVRCPDLHDPNAFAVRVIGDSMEPKFCEGDIVVFSPSVEVHNGDDCFVRFKVPHETTFKRVFFEKKDQIRLQPRNEKYSPSLIEGTRIDGVYRAVIKYEML